MKKYFVLAFIPIILLACSGSEGSPLFDPYTPPPPAAQANEAGIDSSVVDASDADTSSPVDAAPDTLPMDAGFDVEVPVPCAHGGCGKGYRCVNNNCVVCPAKTCAELAFNCGQISDGCNPAPLGCGVCSNGTTCSNENGGTCQCVGPKHLCPGPNAGDPATCVANDVLACGPQCIHCLPDLVGVTPACVNNACDYSTCSAGFTKCPNQPGGPAANGCQNLLTDPNNCGACGIKCPNDKACVAGVCAL